MGSKEGIAIQYGNLGLVYQKRKDIEQAESLLQKSLSLYQEMRAMGHPGAKEVQQALNELAEQCSTTTQ
ncbi:MAG: tetratricopeptide repeat protein [Candidatus Electrothrix sp. YB6]